MTPEQLKASILQYAIQGKLVEQRPEEGTGEELYQQIQAERQRLIQEKKIKKGKPLAEISEDEIPFDIPESWKWTRLGNIFNLIMGQSPDGKSVSESPDGMEFHQGKVYFGEDYIGKSPQTTNAPQKIAEPNSVLLCVRAPVGIVNITNRKLCIGRGLCDVVPLGGMNEKFTLNWLRCFKNAFIKKATGTTFVAITGDTVKNQVVPLPPLAEQKRIVAKIEELLLLVDRYAVAYEKLEQFNAKFPEDMKKSILQYAIQGKLVEQRPEEGTGEELYQQIQAEKQHLIAEKKIKKEKPLPEIAENEIPFDIPESWKWVRLNNIAESIVDCPHSTPKYLDMETEYCTIDTNCIDGKGDITKWRYVDADTYTARIARLTPQKDDIVYTREGSICRAAILPEGPKVCLGQRVMLIRSANGVFPQFIRRLLMSPMVIRKLTEQQKGIGAKHVNVSDVCNLILPLPPLAEQERIVAKLEEILPLCERLK